MTERSVEPPAPPTPGNPIERVQRWVQVKERRVRRIPLVVSIQRILDTYNAAGGGITSSGLSYGALFAVIPGLLLTLSLLVIVVDNEDVRQQAVDWITTQVPPLKTFAEQIVGSIAQQARFGTVLGLVLFIWGASGFYLALEGAMERLFPGPRRRDPIMGRVRGAIAVVLVVGTVIAMFLVSYSIPTIGVLKELSDDLSFALPAVTPALAVGVSAFVCLIVYVLVPSDTPGWRAAWAPALAAGVGIGLLTSLFGLVSQYLVGGFSALGVLSSVFVALVWFNWVFQMLLYGGAWARLRRDWRQARGVPR
jgi:YihY family inner membrane protein